MTFLKTSLTMNVIFWLYPLQYNLTICFYELILPSVHSGELFIFDISAEKNIKGEDNIGPVLKCLIYFFSNS